MLPDNGEIFINGFIKMLEHDFAMTTQDKVLMVAILVVSLILMFILCRRCGL